MRKQVKKIYTLNKQYCKHKKLLAIDNVMTRIFVMDILNQRLSNQLLGNHSFKNPVEVVKHMLCMQAQDFTQMKRAIASRCGCSEEDIIDTFNSGQLVRTWTQRGTIHVTCAEDAGRLVKLCASKTLGGFKKRREYLGITDTQIDDILELLPEILSQGPMIRTAIAQELTCRGFDLASNKPYHIMCYAGTLGMTLQGPIIDGEHAFVLSDYWIKNTKILSEDESLKELCLRYFRSHGPATIVDLQWRSGLGIGQIKKGIALLGENIQNVQNYQIIMGGDLNHSESSIHFLASFDEFLLGYKDRTATLDLEHHRLVDKARNGVFKSTLIIDGKTVATRSLKHKSKYSELLISPFEKLNISIEELQKASESLSSFLVKELSVSMVE